MLAGTVNTSADPGTNANVDSAGYARVAVSGSGTPGTSTITVSTGDVRASADIVLYGDVASISASAEKSAITLDEKTFIVVTATDSGGNGVAGVRVNRKSGASGIVGPGLAQNEVTVRNTVDKDVAPVGGVSAGKGDIPACGTAPARTDDADTTGVDESTWWTGNGTNSDGQCVIEVEAQNPQGTAGDAARGTHTITINALAGATTAVDSDVDAVTVEIQVGGAPAAIESDAPDRIDPSTELTVNITVLDDEAVRVGSVTIEVIQTAGDGSIITQAAGSTRDGRAKFTYLAPSTPGVVEFLVRTKDADGKVTQQLPIIIAIAEEAPPEPPAPPTPAISVSGQSGSIGVLDAGSLEDLLGALDCGGNAGTTVTIDGSTYIVGAPDVVNAAFLANDPFPIEFGGAYVNCR